MLPAPRCMRNWENARRDVRRLPPPRSDARPSRCAGEEGRGRAPVELGANAGRREDHHATLIYARRGAAKGRVYHAGEDQGERVVEVEVERAL